TASACWRIPSECCAATTNSGWDDSRSKSSCKGWRSDQFEGVRQSRISLTRLDFPHRQANNPGLPVTGLFAVDCESESVYGLDISQIHAMVPALSAANIPGSSCHDECFYFRKDQFLPKFVLWPI